ncbi:hypothetical protein OSTOST_08868 [Ostertagia ostertagi]
MTKTSPREHSKAVRQFVKFKAAFDDYVSKLPNPGQAPPPPPAGVPAAPPAGVPAAPPIGVPAAPPVGVPAAPFVPSPCASPMETASPRPSPIAQQVGAAPPPVRAVQTANAHPAPQVPVRPPTAAPAPQAPVRPPVPSPGGAAPFRGTVGAPGGPPGAVKNANPPWPPRQGATNPGAIVSAPAFSPQDRGDVTYYELQGHYMNVPFSSIEPGHSEDNQAVVEHISQTVPFAFIS